MADVGEALADQDTEGAVSAATQKLKDPASAMMPKSTVTTVTDPAQSLLNKVHNMKAKAGKKILQSPADQKVVKMNHLTNMAKQQKGKMFALGQGPQTVKSAVVQSQVAKKVSPMQKFADQASKKLHQK